MMPTKKQRRRQQKLRRHEWEEVWVDEEGREVEVDEPPAPAKPRNKAESAKARPAQRGGSRRVVRPAPPPSWRRVAKRGAILAPLFFVAVFYLQKQGDRNVATAALTTIWMMGLFLPFSYLMDRTIYRRAQRARGLDPEPTKKR
jgi:hypothetical protein